MIEPIIKDNFFEDPDWIRNYALSGKVQYWPGGEHPSGANYPGMRSNALNLIENAIFEEVANGIYDILGVDYSTPSYIESFLQYCVADDGNSWVHRDTLYFNPTHVGLIYLTPDPPPDSGTILYQAPADYVYGRDPELDSGNPDDYKIKKVLDNKYNRFVMYDPDEFHKSDQYFGTNIRDGRLFIVFFMKLG